MHCLLHRFRIARRHAALRAAMAAVLVGLPAASAQEHLSKTGEADREIVLHDHAGWDRTCAAIAPPSVQLDRPPLHGTVCVRADDIRIEYISYGTQAHCIGRMVRGLRLIYRSHAGYAGGDVVHYSVQYPKSRREVSVSVAVTPPAPATSGAASASVTLPPRQVPGAVPPCNDFVS
jgi:hypothetical protein